jgi:hypothetical protein
MHVVAADFQGEEHVDPFQGDGAVDVEEVRNGGDEMASRGVELVGAARAARLAADDGRSEH